MTHPLGLAGAGMAVQPAMAGITEKALPRPLGAPGKLSLRTFAAFGSRPFRYLWLNTFTFTLANGIQRFALSGWRSS